MPEDNLFTLEDLLSGQPQRRARTALFLIESHVARLADQARRAMEVYPSESAAAERDLLFLQAFSAGKDPPLRPTIQDLERFASSWAHLVPDNPRLRAALAHLLGEKYRFSAAETPGLRNALGLNETEVQVAYSRLYGAPLTEIYTASPRPAERLRWLWARLNQRLENLPPFWTAYSLTLTETVGASILALPIALAGMGPLPGVAILIALGLVNILTILYVTEALTRTASIRFGNAFFGRMVAEYLGRPGSLLFTACLLLLGFLVQIAYYTGFSTSLGAALRLPPMIPAALLFLVTLIVLRRQALHAAIGMALIVGGVNLLLIIALSLLGLAHFRPEYFLRMDLPFLNGRPFDASLLNLVFGTALAAYFGHTSTANCARIVLRRDESGRSLIWGAMAAQVSAILLYSLFVVSITSALPPAALAGFSGTALQPLAQLAGPLVHVLGSIFVILGMGMASIHFAFGIFNLVRERLPTRSEPLLRLPRRRAKLVLSSRGPEREPERTISSLGLVYLGLERGQPLLRLDIQAGERIVRLERAVAARLQCRLLLGELFPGFVLPELAVEVVEASPAYAWLRLDTSMQVTYCGELDDAGLDPASLLSLPDEQKRLLQQILRRPERGLEHLLADTGKSRAELQPLLDALIAQGYLREVPGQNGSHFSARFSQRRSRRLPEEVWSGLGFDGEGPGSPANGRGHFAQRWLEALIDRGGSFWLPASPLAAVFLLVEWLLWSGAESFVGPLSFTGILTVSLLAGLFPCLLLLSSRRKGELLPGVIYRLLGHPLVVALIYLFSLATLFVHGLFIWEDPFQRLTAVATGVLALATTLLIARHGAFTPRLIVELRADGRPGKHARFSVISGGKPANVSILWGYEAGMVEQRASAGTAPHLNGLQVAIFDLTGLQPAEIKVWAHRLEPDGESLPLPARAEMSCQGEELKKDLSLGAGQALFKPPFDLGSCSPILRMVFEREEEGASDGV